MQAVTSQMAAAVAHVFPEAAIPMGRNPILECDSYKLSHPDLYPAGITGMHSNIVARTSGDTIVFFGLQQYLLSRFLTMRVTMAHVDEAAIFSALHGEPFNRKAWEKVVNVYGGYVPLTIRAVPEGTKVPSGNVLMTIECTDPDLFWMPSNKETAQVRAVWYPSSIATNDLANYRMLKRFANDTCDDLSMVPFQMHDFGGRGVTCGEQAEIGGAAHLAYFMGSDTVEGVRAANYYYGIDMAGFSVTATEHSIECAYGPMRAKDYLSEVIAKTKPGSIVSLVIDGYNMTREVITLCTDLKEQIINSGAKVVFRPDSGDPKENLPMIMKMQAGAFGSKINSKGHKLIGWMDGHPLGGCVGTLQGDGVDYEAASEIMEIITGLGYASSNLVFGSGGGLLQKVNRDTYKWAQKATAIKVGGKWEAIFKDPITDPGKKSFAGRKTLVRSKMTGEYMTADVDGGPLDGDWTDVMQTVMDEKRPGELLVRTTMAEVRERALA